MDDRNTDRELLEKAAKAAGIVVIRSRLDDPMHRDFLVENGARNLNERAGPWNPLTDDGDALRLAVKLSMNLVVTCKSPSLPLGVTDARSTESGWATESHAMCPYAATRRAIVRAAAAMGES